MAYFFHHQDDSIDKKEALEVIFSKAVLSLKRNERDFLKNNDREYQLFLHRVEKYLPDLISVYFEIYQSCIFAYPFLIELLTLMIRSWIERDRSLKQIDLQREISSDWLTSNQIIGGVCYVDLFAKDLKGLEEQIPYFKELGLTYIHLMPLFLTKEGDNDGGYAISSYRDINPKLGTIENLRELAKKFRENDILLVIDFVFNHTSDEHIWAKKARKNNARYKRYYWIYEDRKIPDQYERTLREIFPDEHPGAFTWKKEMESWVWTTFHSYQWDLNYQNPEVFVRMADEMLFLANLGVDILRLDAVAFIWKQKGTNCENLPQAYKLVEAFNLIARIAAPALQFKSEAIVHPDEVIRYISKKRCQLSYNPLLMALLWETLATREVKLLAYSMEKRFTIPDGTVWVNYIRCHDDIGWTFSDEDASALGINGYDHRKFLNQFYTGKFPGSFARGYPFQENPATGDCRISGTLASLAGLEKAILENDSIEEEHATDRILLLFSIIMTIGGIPLIYLGDEVGSLNNYNFLKDEQKKNDSRWIHRFPYNADLYAKRHDLNSPAGKIWSGIQQLIQLRKKYDVFQTPNINIINSGNQHVLAFTKENSKHRVLVLANFSEHEQLVESLIFIKSGNIKNWTNIMNHEPQEAGMIFMKSYQFFCFLADLQEH
jgi:glycosidase